MDELTIDGKIYISSKRAAAVSGYAKDYVGQLCREGRVDSKLVGRSWYVYEPSLKKHRFSDEIEASETPVEQDTSPVSPIEQVWEAPAYTAEIPTTLPEVTPKPLQQEVVRTPEGKSISEMQSAWQDWFATRAPVTEPIAKYEEEVAEPASLEVPISVPEVPVRIVKEESAASYAQEVPVRIVSDIVPSMPVQRAENRLSRTSKRSHKATHHPKIAQALTGAFIVLVISVVLVATGLIDVLHLGGIGNSPVINFLKGSTVIEK